MEKQVLSKSQMRELKDLGIDISNASMCWVLDKDDEPYLMVYRETDFGDIIPTFTLQDILEILPNWIDPYYYNVKYQKNLFYHEYVNKWICSYVASNGASIQLFEADSPLEAAFNMLKWCKQNKYI